MKKTHKFLLALLSGLIYFIIMNYFWERNYELDNYKFYLGILVSLAFGFALVYLLMKIPNETKK